MTIVTRSLIAGMTLLMAATAHTAQFIPTERVKTGIHPDGGFYKLYQVQCDSKTTTTIASLEGNRRWCVANDESMNCYKRKQTAANNACSGGATLATTSGITTDAGYR